ncbi:unnamed protein product, partial [Ectocarpus sp. 13 AM-2016]
VRSIQSVLSRSCSRGRERQASVVPVLQRCSWFRPRDNGASCKGGLRRKGHTLKGGGGQRLRERGRCDWNRGGGLLHLFLQPRCRLCLGCRESCRCPCAYGGVRKNRRIAPPRDQLRSWRLR